MQQPQGKVRALPSGQWQPLLVWSNRLVQLGEHATREAAECAYDVGKLLVGEQALGLAACPAAGTAAAIGHS